MRGPLRAMLPQPAGQMLPGATLSVVTHAALIALAVMGVAVPASSRRTHAPLRAPRVEMVRYVALAPPPTPVPVAPRATAPHPRSRPTPPPDAVPTELRQPRVTVEENDSADDPPDAAQLAGLAQAVQHAPLLAMPAAAPQAENAGGAAEDAPGSLRVVELRTPTSTACPVLRRRPGMGDEEVHVTVAFEVDSGGAVDSSTIRVLELPGQPRAEYRTYSHLFAVTTPRLVDRKLRDMGPGYADELAADLIRHVVALRFRPARRNGRPVRASVLVTCQST